jgi:hypothetical protein
MGEPINNVIDLSSYQKDQYIDLSIYSRKQNVITFPKIRPAPRVFDMARLIPYLRANPSHIQSCRDLAIRLGFDTNVIDALENSGKN